MKAQRKNKLIGVLISILFLISCSNNDVFLKYQTINSEGWNTDSLCIFDIPVTDSLATYNIYINVRNKSNYPYQNLWLYINRTSPDSTIVKDTIEFYLADQRGKWLGSGIGSVLEMPVLYQQNIKFNRSGTYQYEIVHGMRDTILTGINDIGIRVEKAE